jgi:hypothetical protein
VALSHKGRELPSFTLLESTLAVLGITVRAEEKTLSDVALESELTVPPSPKLFRIGGCLATALRTDDTGGHHLAS